ESAVYSTLQAGPEFARWRTKKTSTEYTRAAPDVDDAPAVAVERDGDRLHVTLMRPHVHNAFNTDMRDGLVEALMLADADASVTAVVVDGAGPSFCSGGDLTEFATLPDPARAHLIRLTRSAA